MIATSGGDGSVVAAEPLISTKWPFLSVHVHGATGGVSYPPYAAGERLLRGVGASDKW